MLSGEPWVNLGHFNYKKVRKARRGKFVMCVAAPASTRAPRPGAWADAPTDAPMLGLGATGATFDRIYSTVVTASALHRQPDSVRK